MTVGLTAQQANLLGFIELQMSGDGIAPSFSEMAVYLGFDPKSKAGVHRLLGVLEDKGFIRRFPKRARSIEIIGPHSDCPHCGEALGSPACRDAARRSRITYSRTPSQPGARQ